MIAPKVSRLSSPRVSQSFQHFFSLFYTSPHSWWLTCLYVSISLEDNMELKYLWLFDNGLVQLTRPCMFFVFFYPGSFINLPFPRFFHLCTSHAAFCSLLLAWFWLQAFVYADLCVFSTFLSPFYSSISAFQNIRCCSSQ